MRRRMKETLRDLTRRTDPLKLTKQNKNTNLCNRCVESLIRTSSWKSDTHTHHETLQSFKDSLAQDCWICMSILSRLSPRQREVLLDESTYSDTLYFSFVQIADSSEPSVAGPKGSFGIHFLLAAAGAIRDLARSDGMGDGGSSLHLWAQPSFSIDQRMLATPEGDATSGEEAWAKAKGWLRNCDAHHKVCTRSTRNFQYPARVLDVKHPDMTVDCVRLMESAHADLQGDYVTLSHSWGTAPFLTLRNDNLDDFKIGIHISDLNKTFQHAIRVTRQMQIRYLWIDSLCIIQNDPSLADWAIESVKMGQYYTNAYCNISATASRSGSEGLFRSRNHVAFRHVQCDLPSGYGRVEGPYNLFNTTLFDYHLNEAPLHRRAWVLQERLLARRVLHFCEDQLMWECREYTASEQFPFGVPNVAPLLDHSRFKDLNLRSLPNQEYFATKDANEIGFALWSRIAQEYSECYLTFARDKTNALQGLIGLFENMLEDECVFGCWRSRLERDLLWRPTDMSYPSVNRLYDMPRHYDDIPSWSWMSSDVPLIRLDPPGSHTLKEESFLFRVVLSSNQDPNSTSETPSTREQHAILLQCLMLPVQLCLELRGNLAVRYQDDTNTAAADIQYIYLDRQHDGLEQVGDHLSIFVVPMRRSAVKERGSDRSNQNLECLLLITSGEKQYERLGIMHVDGRAAVRTFSDPRRSQHNLSSWGYDEKTNMHTISLI